MVKAWAAAMRLMSVLLCPFFAKNFGFSGIYLQKPCFFRNFAAEKLIRKKLVLIL